MKNKGWKDMTAQMVFENFIAVPSIDTYTNGKTTRTIVDISGGVVYWCDGKKEGSCFINSFAHWIKEK